MKLNFTEHTKECSATLERPNMVLDKIRLPTEARLLREVSQFAALVSHSVPNQSREKTDITFSLEQHVLSVSLAEMNHDLSKRIYAILARLNVDDEEIFIKLMPAHEYNAFALHNPFNGSLVLGLNSGILDAYSLSETGFIIGHELAHHHLYHTRHQHKIAIQSVPEEHPLSRNALALSRRQEISADRFGLLCCGGNLETALVTIRKTVLQAVGRNLESNPQVQPLYKFYDAELDGYKPWEHSHPHMSIRYKGLIAWAPIAQSILGKEPVCHRELSGINSYCEDLLSGMDHDEDKTKMERERFAQAVKILEQKVVPINKKTTPSLGQTDLAPQLLFPDSAEALTYLNKVASPGKRIRLFDFLAGEALRVKKITTAQCRLEELAEQLDILPAYKKRVASMITLHNKIFN